tara:strand:+ start:408 stop:764 length:357 start_codon:yes stop_codon:yes gene_type:complete
MQPLSPHVQIYKFPITAVSSITNRITGVALTCAFISGGMICNTPLKGVIEVEYKKLPPAVNGVMVFPFIYHTLGGLRHLIWDMYPNLLTTRKVAKSSYILFGTSITSSIAYCIYSASS